MNEINTMKKDIKQKLRSKRKDALFLLNNCPKHVYRDWKEIINLVGELNVKVNWGSYEMEKEFINQSVGRPTPLVRASVKGTVFNDVAYWDYGVMSDFSNERTDELNKQIVRSIRYLLLGEKGQSSIIKRNKDE